MSRAALPRAAAAASLLLLSCGTTPYDTQSLELPPAAARSDDPAHVTLSLADLGLREAWSHNNQPTLTFPFQARADRVMSDARIRLQIAEEIDPSWHIRELQILVNQDKVLGIGLESLKRDKRERIIALDPQLLGSKNTLTLALLLERDGPCGTIPRGAWRLIEGGELLINSSPLPLPNDLGLLPLPFVDRGVDRAASVPIVLPPSGAREVVRAAGVLASWFGVQNGAALSFPVSQATLPDASCVVLIDSPDAAAAVGLAPPEGASAQLLDHPLHRGGNVKLLVLAGRTPAELMTAVLGLTAEAAHLTGPKLSFGPAAPRAPLAPYQSPRWMPAGRALRLDRIPGFEGLTHAGRSGGKMSLRFRVPPDLWVWPAENVLLDLGYTITTAKGAGQPRLDVLFNDGYLGTLPPMDLARGQTVGRALLRVHRSRLHGFNELSVFVAWPEADELTCGGAQSSNFKVTITGDSTLHLESLRHFANLPDVSLFVHDGYPFTRLPDLADTAVVLPDAPRPSEHSLYFSTLAYFGSVTGVVGDPALLTAEAVLRSQALDRDLLVIGAPDREMLQRRWADDLPLAIGAESVVPQMPEPGRGLYGLLDGGVGYRELGRARATVAGISHLTAVLGMRSPLDRKRAVVFLTATSEADFVPLTELQGYADATTHGGDLLVAGGGKRFRFRIGPSYALGRLAGLDAVRWFLANRVVALLGCALLGVLCLGSQVRRALARHVGRRLREGLPEL